MQNILKILVLFAFLVPGSVLAEDRADRSGETTPAPVESEALEQISAQGEPPAAEAVAPEGHGEELSGEIAYEEPETAPEKKPAAAEPLTEAQLAETFSELESLGLYTRVGDGGMGSDLWANAPRSAATALLRAMPVTAEDPAVQRVILGVLLTQANAGSIRNDVPLVPGGDLLTLRLEKLLEAGAFRQAADLYGKIKDDPYDTRLARAGTLAMLYSGQKSLACLEANIAAESFAADAFWADVSAYCDATMAERPLEGDVAVLEKSPSKLLLKLATEASYRFPYDPGSFSALSTLERAALAADHRIDLAAVETGQIAPAHIQIFFDDPALGDAQRFDITARAVGLGLLSESEMKPLFLKAVAPAAGQDAPATSPIPAGDEREKLAQLYRTATDKFSGADQWETLRQVLALKKSLGSGALRPFAAMLHKVEPKSPSADEMIAAYTLFAESGMSIPGAWAAAIDRIDSQSIDINKYSMLMAAAYMSEGSGRRNPESLKALKAALSEAKPEISALAGNIIENIDNDRAGHDNTDKVYENELNLTFGIDYVMPSVNVWDRAVKASQSKATSETILLNTVLLRNQALHGLYPGLLLDVLQGFKNVGLTGASEDMARAALLGGAT